MIVSWNWLSKYVKPSVSMDEVIDKLTMSGLNHEGTESVFGDDFAIDLEVTSNRADCLGHLGVAREVLVLLQRAGALGIEMTLSRFIMHRHG